MRLKIFDRILLAILLIAAIIVSFVLFGVAAHLVRQEWIEAFVANFYNGYAENRWILAGCGLALLLICIKLMFCGRDKKEIRPASTLIRQSDIGGTYISLSAVDAMAQKYCRAQSRVRECYTLVSAVQGGITIGVRLSVLPDTDIASLTSELQTNLKQYVESLTGITVQEIGVLVESASAAPGSTAVARAE